MNTQEQQSKLEAEKDLLEGELKGMARYSEETDEWEAVPEVQATGGEADPNDLADRSGDFEERSATVYTLTTRLNDIKHAIRNISAGTYGMCENCGNKIEEDRLGANPAARTCKACM